MSSVTPTHHVPVACTEQVFRRAGLGGNAGRATAALLSRFLPAR